MPAGRLELGQRVANHNGCTVTVVGVSADSVQTVFNLEIANDHSYFVGRWNVWVHNAFPFGCGFDPTELGDIEYLTNPSIARELLVASPKQIAAQFNSYREVGISYRAVITNIAGEGRVSIGIVGHPTIREISLARAENAAHVAPYVKIEGYGAAFPVRLSHSPYFQSQGARGTNFNLWNR